MNKLQKIQLMILKDVDKVCKENGIKYYLVGGTLLGAVRHKGFIPWDDDLDIAMYREDYVKFKALMSEFDSEKYFIQNFDTDNNYIRYITKVRLNGTKQVERQVDSTEIHHGIYIDVFPLDRVDKKNGVDLKLRGKLLKYLYLFKVAYINNPKSNDRKIKKIIKKYLQLLSKLIPPRLINNMYDYLCTKTNKKNCKYTTSFASGYGWKKQLFPNEYYGDGLFLEFEGNFFRVPERYDLILESLFGNYMELPPVSRRNSGHDLVEIDYGIYQNIDNEV